MPNKKRNDEKQPENTHTRRRNLIIGRDSETLFSMSFLSVLLIHSICANGCGGKGGGSQHRKKFCHLVKLVSEFIYRTEGRIKFSASRFVRGSLSDEASTKRRKTIERIFPTTCAWKGEICCRRERRINLKPFNIGYCLCCCCCYLIKFWSFSRRMSLMARVFFPFARPSAKPPGE